MANKQTKMKDHVHGLGELVIHGHDSNPIVPLGN